jgi:pyruvate,water dikinase
MPQREITVGLCGQALVTFQNLHNFFRGSNDSISFNPDAIIKGIENILETERKYGNDYK